MRVARIRWWNDGESIARNRGGGKRVDGATAPSGPRVRLLYLDSAASGWITGQVRSNPKRCGSSQITAAEKMEST